MMNKEFCNNPSILKCLTGLTLLLGSGTAFANAIPGTAPCGRAAGVYESAAPGVSASWDIYLSDCYGRRIPGAVLRRSGTGTVYFPIAGTYNGVAVGDADNVTVIVPKPPRPRPRPPARVPHHPHDPNPHPFINPNPPVAPGHGVGATSILSLESLYIDPITGLYTFEGMFSRVYYNFGRPTTVYIPDLFADTNGDGVIGAGDILYSWLDMNEFLKATVIYSLGDIFTIVNGQVSGIRGMWFSPTPIYLDPILGPRPTGGFWFNPVSAAGAEGALSGPSSLSVGLNGEVLSEHPIVGGVPEPSAWALLIAGFAGIGAALRRRRHLTASVIA